LPSAALKNPLVQLFRRKLQIALQLTQHDYRREAKQGGNHAAVLARLSPLVHANFKPVAQIASQLIATGFAWEVEEVHGTTGWVISDLRTNPYPVNVLREDEFQDMFTDVWCRLVLEAELEAPSQPSTRTQTVSGDARSRALAGEEVSRSPKELKKSGEKELRRRIICEAAELEGPEYCQYLHDHGLQTPELWQKRGCPKSYPAAYKIKRWRKSIQQEKTRVVKESRNDPGKKSSKPVTVQ